MSRGATPLVRLATPADLAYIVQLAKRETDTIGFVPHTHYHQAIRDRHVWLVEENGMEAGFCLYAHTRSYLAHVQQIAVQDDARHLELGRAMIERIERLGVPGISLRCWEHLPSNAFWRALGFRLLGTDTRPTRRGRFVNRYVKLLK